MVGGAGLAATKRRGDAAELICGRRSARVAAAGTTAEADLKQSRVSGGA
jgi:hypothetical protein